MKPEKLSFLSPEEKSPEKIRKGASVFSDSLNCWFLLCLKQTFHNLTGVSIIGLLILLQLFIYDSGFSNWPPNGFFTLLLCCGGGAGICVFRTFGRPMKSDIGIKHFMDFSPIRPRQILAGLLFSYGFFLLLFLCLCLPALLTVLFYHFSRIEILGCRLWYITVVPLAFIFLITATRWYRPDTAFLVIALILLLSGPDMIKSWESRYLLSILVIVVCIFAGQLFLAGLRPAIAERERRTRIGQLILILIGYGLSDYLQIFIASGEVIVCREMIAVVAIAAAVSALSSMGEAIAEPSRRIRRELPRGIFRQSLEFILNGSSAGGWFWTLPIVLLAYSITDLYAQDAFWNFLVMILLISGSLAYAGSMFFFRMAVRLKYPASPPAVYGLLTSGLTLVLIIVLSTLPMFWNGKTEDFYRGFASLIWYAALLPFLSLRRIIADFRLFLRNGSREGV